MAVSRREFTKMGLAAFLNIVSPISFSNIIEEYKRYFSHNNKSEMDIPYDVQDLLINGLGGLKEFYKKMAYYDATSKGSDCLYEFFDNYLEWKKETTQIEKNKRDSVIGFFISSPPEIYKVWNDIIREYLPSYHQKKENKEGNIVELTKHKLERLLRNNKDPFYEYVVNDSGYLGYKFPRIDGLPPALISSEAYLKKLEKQGIKISSKTKPLCLAGVQEYNVLSLPSDKEPLKITSFDVVFWMTPLVMERDDYGRLVKLNVDLPVITLHNINEKYNAVYLRDFFVEYDGYAFPGEVDMTMSVMQFREINL